jgi:hypothetical protein
MAQRADALTAVSRAGLKELRALTDEYLHVGSGGSN